MRKSHPLLAHINQKPLMIDPDAEAFMGEAMMHLISMEHGDELTGSFTASSSDDDFWYAEDDWRSAYRPYTVINGILQIPVQGVLLSKFPWQLGRWVTGYKYIEMAMRRGLEDFAVRGIALVVDSPGGEVTECFELTDKIYDWRGLKPIRGYAANHAYSAAMSTISAVDPGQVIVTRSGGVGSVGVVTAHVDFSEYMKDQGIKVTFIYAGSHKVDGNPYQKLSDSVKERIQQRIDKIYGVFVGTVARNRDLSEDDVRATEALTYDAEDAIEVGFADRVGELEEELIIYADEVGETGDEFMANLQGNVTGQKPGETAMGYTQEQLDKACADARTEGKAEGVKEGLATGAQNERDRASAIRALPEGENKPAAVNMMIEMGASVDQAKVQLAKMPAETQAKIEPEKPNATTQQQTTQTQGQREKSHFDEHMSKTPNPDVGPDKAENEGEKDSAATDMNAIKAATMKATGEKPKQAARA